MQITDLNGSEDEENKASSSAKIWGNKRGQGCMVMK